MTAKVQEGSRSIPISDLEKECCGKRIDLERFLKAFEPNGSQKNEYRHYLSSADDEAYFSSAYENEDPRPIDYTLEDGYDADSVLELPYPELSLFAEITTDKKGVSLLKHLSICKVYATGCVTAGARSKVLIKAEAERVRALMSTVLAK